MSRYQQFRTFLREQGCEVAFDRAFYLYNDCTALDEELWSVGEEAYFVSQAFEWEATPEGRAFWREVDRQWYDIVEL